MIRINLLPIRQIRKRQRLKAEVFLFACALGLVFSLLGAGWLGLNLKAGKLEEGIAALEQKKQSYQAIIKEIETLKKEKQLVEKKLETIKQLKAGSQIAVRVLDEVASRTPTSRLWLTVLQHANGILQLNGVALDNETIAQYMQQLEASEYFEKTELTSSAQTGVAGQKLKSFAITANIVVPNR